MEGGGGSYHIASTTDNIECEECTLNLGGAPGIIYTWTAKIKGLLFFSVYSTFTEDLHVGRTPYPYNSPGCRIFVALEEQQCQHYTDSVIFALNTGK